jgi:hypothetical protein
MKCELETLVDCSDREKLKYWERNLWVLMALSLEDKQSQLKLTIYLHLVGRLRLYGAVR